MTASLMPPLSTIQVRFSEINVFITNFTIIAVFVHLAQSSTLQVGFYDINVILTNFTIMLLPPLSTIYRFAVSSKLFIFTTVTFIKVVMFDCSMHCIQQIIKVQSSKYSLDRGLSLSNNPKTFRDAFKNYLADFFR